MGAHAPEVVFITGGSSGIQRMINLSEGAIDPVQIDPEIDTNLKGLIYVTNAFLPLLMRQPAARLVQVSSGLAFVPLVRAPIYSATKAAVHAFTIALRQQLRGSTVKVIELIPPVVATNLHRDLAQKPPRAMARDTFVAHAMKALDRGSDEAAIGLAQLLRIGVRIAPKRLLALVNPAR
jgi:uncharacterized oxidoreductase